MGERTGRAPLRVKLSDYTFQSGEKLFFDANVWLYVNGINESRGREEKAYSQAFKKILEKKITIFIDVLVVSELVNTYVRQLAALEGVRRNDFKQFRKSDRFKPIADKVVSMMREILGWCECVETGFKASDFNEMLDVYPNGESDFNDQIIAKICKKHKLTLVTHDGDFVEANIPLLTENKKLLQFNRP